MRTLSGIIAVVEDDNLVRDAIGLALESQGWTARLFSRGEDFMTALAVRDRFDVLVLDVNLPDVGGHVLQAQAQQILPELPVIVLTATPQDPRARQALAQGALHLLEKPVSFEALAQAVHAALDGAEPKAS